MAEKMEKARQREERRERKVVIFYPSCVNFELIHEKGITVYKYATADLLDYSCLTTKVEVAPKGFTIHIRAF